MKTKGGGTDDALVAREWRVSERYTFAECVNAEGEARYWLMDSEAASRDSGPVPIPAHELAGKLPKEYAERCGMVCGARCGARKTPCRNRVNSPGERCHLHSGEQKLSANMADRHERTEQ